MPDLIFPPGYQPAANPAAARQPEAAPATPAVATPAVARQAVAAPAVAPVTAPVTAPAVAAAPVASAPPGGTYLEPTRAAGGFSNLDQLGDTILAEIRAAEARTFENLGVIRGSVADVSTRLTGLEGRMDGMERGTAPHAPDVGSHRELAQAVGQPAADAQRERTANVYDGLTAREGTDLKSFNICRALYGHLMKWNTPALRNGPEYRMVMAGMEKAQQADTDSLGGFLVPSEFNATRLIPALEARVIAIQLGATVIPDIVGSPWESPKVTGTPSAGWVGEGQVIGSTEVPFGQIKMTPHGLSRVVKMTNRLLRQTSGQAQNIVLEHLARALARALDVAVIKGTGAAGQPVGAINQAGVQSVDWSAVIPAAATNYAGSVTLQTVTNALEAMVGKLDDADALDLGGRMGWAMEPSVKRYLRSFKDATGRPVLFDTADPANTTGSRTLLWDHPFASSSQLSAGANADLIFANWSTLLIGQWGGVSLDISTEAGDAFTTHSTLVKAYMEADATTEHVEAWCVANGMDVATNAIIPL